MTRHPETDWKLGATATKKYFPGGKAGIRNAPDAFCPHLLDQSFGSFSTDLYQGGISRFTIMFADDDSTELPAHDRLAEGIVYVTHVKTHQ